MENDKNFDFNLPSDFAVTLRKWKLIEIRQFFKASVKNFEKSVIDLLKKCIISVDDVGPYKILGAIDDDGKMDWNKVLDGDWVSLLFQMRARTHGSKYPMRGKCPDCGKVSEASMDIIEDCYVQYLSEEGNAKMALVRKAIYANKRELTVDIEGFGKVTTRFMNVEENIAWRKNVDTEDGEEPDDYSYLLKKLVRVEVDGKIYSNQTVEGYIPISQYIDQLDMDEACDLVDELDEYDFGMTLATQLTCSCGSEWDAGVPINANFFRPDKKRSKKRRRGGRGLKKKKR